MNQTQDNDPPDEAARIANESRPVQVTHDESTYELHHLSGETEIVHYTEVPVATGEVEIQVHHPAKGHHKKRH